VSYTETIYPPAWSVEHKLKDCSKRTYAGLLVGVYIVILQPIGVMKKQYNIVRRQERQ